MWLSKMLQVVRGSDRGADVRDYLAEERTFLAWIRTGLSVMTFGFVIARFGIFLEEIQPHHLSLWFGTALIAAGVVVNLSATRRHAHVVAQLNRGQFSDHRLSRPAVILAAFLALVGMVMIVYLGVVSEW
jgi:putative membrane protein